MYFFHQNNYVVKGVDLDPLVISQGREFFQIDLEVADISKITEKYDLIILSHVLEHIIDLDKFLITIKNILTENGNLYIEVPSAIKTFRSPEDFNTLYDFFEDIQNAHTYYFTLATLQNIMNKNGFELVQGTESIQSLWTYTGKKNISYTNDYANIRYTLKHLMPLQKEIQSLKKEIENLKNEISLLHQIKKTLPYRILKKIYHIIKKP